MAALDFSVFNSEERFLIWRGSCNRFDGITDKELYSCALRSPGYKQDFSEIYARDFGLGF